MELWDAYDRNFKKIEGITLIRGEESSIPKGIYHMVVLILVRHVDGQYLLMRRSPGKAYPLYWEATAGGSVLQGESAIEGALRELREETGIIDDTLEENIIGLSKKRTAHLTMSGHRKRLPKPGRS